MSAEELYWRSKIFRRIEDWIYRRLYGMTWADMIDQMEYMEQRLAEMSKKRVEPNIHVVRRKRWS